MSTAGLRILVTGSRAWRDRDAIAAAITAWLGPRLQAALTDHPSWTPPTIIHGAQVTREKATRELYGADYLAGSIARERGWPEERHPADWERFGYAAGPIRNADMTQAGADVCLAFPIGESRGTRGCVRMAEAAGIPVIVHEGATT